MRVGAFDHLDRVAEDLFAPVDQCARVAAIHEHGLDGTKKTAEPHEHGTGSHAILDAGRVYDHRQQIALSIYRFRTPNTSRARARKKLDPCHDSGNDPGVDHPVSVSLFAVNQRCFAELATSCAYIVASASLAFCT
jgi:hypothetical protein